MDNLHRLTLDLNLLPLPKQNLIRRIAAKSAALEMPCYLVGGFVRDMLLSRPVNDFDFVVEGDATKFGKALVKEFGGKLTAHAKFKTATWFINESEFLDLITARSETYAHPGALPTIKPSTIEDDLRRRDFTINAMAVRLDGDHVGELLDPLNGQAGLRSGLMRVLHPHSFVDDPTRIFRAVRYEKRYAFNIEPSTLGLINSESLAILKKLSGERIRHELDLIFGEEDVVSMLARLNELNILQAVDSNLAFTPLLSLMANLPEVIDMNYDRVTIGYLLWLMDLSSSVISALSKRLDFNSDLTKALLSASQLKKDFPALSNSKPSVWVSAIEKFPLISILAVYLVSHERALLDFLSTWRHVKSHTTGDDLKARGIPPGPRYKEILSRLRAAWLDGEVRNESEEKDLLEFLVAA